MLKFFLSRLTEQLPPAHYRKADFFPFFTSLFLDESDETSNTMNIFIALSDTMTFTMANDSLTDRICCILSLTLPLGS